MNIQAFPSPVQMAFIKSQALENCVMAPRGEGKTSAGIISMGYHASMQDKAYRPMPWAIIRDTWSNLERTTLQSFLLPRPGTFEASIRSRLIVRDGGRYLELPGLWVAWLFGVDTPSDLNKLLSMQLAGVWLEEAAPAMEADIGSGVGEETWAVAISSLRHPVNTNRRAQITMNYPDEDHWTWIRFFENPTADQKLFRIPSGENQFIDSQYRENMAKALSNRPDLMARLVEGKPAHVQVGEAVTPEYHESYMGMPWHRSDQVLTPVKGATVYRFWDGGLNPTSVFVQVTNAGRMVGLGTRRGINVGMKQFIANEVKPFIAERFGQVEKWKDFGDPSLRERDQSDSTVTAAKIIEEELGTTFEGGISDWPSRREAMRELFTSILQDGVPKFILSKDDGILHRALNGGWHYRKDPTGRIIYDIPVKDISSHPGDALSHGLAKIFRYQKEKRLVLPIPNKRAYSYAVQQLHKRAG